MVEWAPRSVPVRALVRSQFHRTRVAPPREQVGRGKSSAYPPRHAAPNPRQLPPGTRPPTAAFPFPIPSIFNFNFLQLQSPTVTPPQRLASPRRSSPPHPSPTLASVWSDCTGNGQGSRRRSRKTMERRRGRGSHGRTTTRSIRAALSSTPVPSLCFRLHLHWQLTTSFVSTPTPTSTYQQLHANFVINFADSHRTLPHPEVQLAISLTSLTTLSRSRSRSSSCSFSGSGSPLPDTLAPRPFTRWSHWHKIIATRPQAPPPPPKRQLVHK
ncbi:hypothetical protein DFH09DRAFT_447635 [Mycena vulgaris]|nr:hypothetical protein DFH09DRAFT_447635 [Mycena vulgaris]